MSDLTAEQKTRIEQNRLRAEAIRAERKRAAVAAPCQPGPSTSTGNNSIRPPVPVVRPPTAPAPSIRPPKTGFTAQNFYSAPRPAPVFGRGRGRGRGIPSGRRVNGPQTEMIEVSSSQTATVVLALCDRDRFALSCPFNQDVIDACKMMPTRKYEPASRKWSFNLTDYNGLVNALEPLSATGKIKVNGLPSQAMKIFGPAIRGEKRLDSEDYDLSQVDLTKKLPEQLVNRLYGFQQEGVKGMIAKHGRALLADEMGLGKTVQAACVCSFYRADWPLLVVCPSSMRYSWEEALLIWVPGLNRDDVYVLTSGKDVFPSVGKDTVVICSYDIAVIQKNTLVERKFDVVVLDESHFVKNFKTKRYKAIEAIVRKSKRLLLLTGTPALSRPEELYSQVTLLKRGMFGQFMDYGLRYCDAKRNQWAWDFSGASNTEELRILLEETVMIRRLKKDVLEELPEKMREMVILDKTSVRTNLKALQKAAEAAENATGGERHGALLKYFHETSFAKLTAVRDYVFDILSSGTKILVFAHHTNVLDDLAMNLAQKKIGFIRIDGKTPPEARKRHCDEFQTDENIRVAILSILAANTGLTLTAGKLVIFAELYWNPGQLMQAEDRVHRVGQSENVQIKYLVARGTADDCLWPIIQRKLSVLGQVGLNKESFSNVPNSVIEDQARDTVDVHVLCRPIIQRKLSVLGQVGLNKESFSNVPNSVIEDQARDTVDVHVPKHMRRLEEYFETIAEDAEDLDDEADSPEPEVTTKRRRVE